MAGSSTMNIGIFVTSLNPKSAAQARFQGALFAGLESIGACRYRFIVFSHDVPKSSQHSEDLTCVQIDPEGRWSRAARFLKSTIGKVLLLACDVFEGGSGRFGRHIALLTKHEPRYYKQLRELNVRLLWNMNQHELPTCLPFIRTVWEANHRIHPMFPEYSYARFTFDGLDRNMAYSLARASYVVVGTKEGKQQLVSMFGVHESKIRVIPFPTPVLATSNTCSASESSTRNSYLFYPARFWPHKNHVVILAAMKILQDKWNIKLCCVFSGADEGNLKYVLQYAEKLGVRDQVEYVGVVPEEDLALLYRGALALVYASAVGPDNLPPLEAMSLDCPVITAEVPGAREQYGDAALYFDSMSEQDLAERIKELLQNNLVREQLIHRGRQRAESWTARDYAREMISIFDEFAAVARAWERCDSVFT
jgi:glycosyltransferase involved in cell wall biosynthesis